MSKNNCWRFGDNIDTDQILPSQYLVFPLDAMLSHILETQSDRFAKEVKVGDFIVAGDNFGCGSSREQAPLVLKEAGIKAIIAQSFARIFYRNAINMGLFPIELKDTSEFKDGDSLQINYEDGLVINNSTNKKYSFAPLEGMVKDIFDKGGLVPYIQTLQAK